MINRLKSIKKAVEITFGIDIDSIKLFGSYSRGEAREDSDIDILISSKNSLSLKDIVILEKIFELGVGTKKIDLVLDNEMNKEIREVAEKEMIDV
ncbi:MAG: nucleotidyltransferase domain-containing protein [Oligoflexus sp.]|nr:nucleotidyltransferase domain-containing protein [Oligoflexus sp.]